MLTWKELDRECAREREDRLRAEIARLRGVIETALCRDDIADDELGDMLRDVLTKREA